MSSCNETNTELLVVLVGPYVDAGVTATLLWIIPVLAFRLPGYGKVRHKLMC